MATSRYKMFSADGTNKIVPFVEIATKTSDLYTYYEVGKTRLDLLSYQYYDDPEYGWLILQANPQYGAYEYKIPDKAKLRIPYPLDTTLTQYESDIERYYRLNGNVTF